MSILPHLLKEASMQNSTIFNAALLQTLVDKFVEGVRRGLKKTHDIFQPKYYTEDSKHTHSLDVKECCGTHLFYLSRQITFVVGEINKARVKGKSIPKKPIQWVKDATAFKDQVIIVLFKEDQSSLKPDEKHDLCGQILDYMKHCPVEGNYDEPITYVAGLHEKEDGNKCCSESVQSEDDAAVAESGAGLNESLEGPSSSQVLYDDDKIPEILEIFEFTKDQDEASQCESSSPSYISKIHIEEICESEIREECDQEKLVTESSRRSEKMPMHVGELEHPKMGGRKNSGESDDADLFTHDNESELDMSVQISENLRFEILSSSTSRKTLNLNVAISFGLDSERDNYMFSSTAEKGTNSEEAEYVIVDRSGRNSNEMPIDNEWRQAGVVNLSEKSSLLLKEKLDCPNLALLFLQRNNSLNHIPSSFFDRMPCLRFLDLSYTRISALPASLFKLTDLKVLMLRSCVCLESLPTEVENLGNMQVLDLSNTDLYYLPEEIGQLTRLKHLHLSFYGSDYGCGYACLPSEILSPSIFSALKDLEELSVVVHPEDQRWIRIADEIIHHIKWLEKLRHLQFYFPSVEALNSFVKMSPSWNYRRMRRFKFVVGHNVRRIISRVPDEVESKYDRLDRCLRFVNGSHEVPEVMKNLLISVKAFYLDHHLDIQDLSEFGVFNFKELEFCVVRECPNFQVMMIGDKSSSESAFPNLEHLEMHYLWELERIWEDPVPPGSFKALTSLIVDTCPKLEYIASQSMLQCLSNLETFVIEDCESLKSIVKEKKRAKYSEATLLPRLTKLVLRHLPRLATLGSGLRPSDEIIIRQFCPNLILSPHPESTKRRKFLGLSC